MTEILDDVVAAGLAGNYQYSVDRVIDRFRSLTERLERIGMPSAGALSRNRRTPYVSAAAEVVSEIRNTIGNLNFDGLIMNATEADHELARQAALPDIDRLARIIREVDGNHKLGAGALAEAIVAELGKD